MDIPIGYCKSIDGVKRGEYVRKLVDSYCVLDLETTGLSVSFDEIIEVAILKIENKKVVDSYSQLINPGEEISDFITELTGITNEMLQNQPSIMDVKEKVLGFIGDSIVVGHNTSFDMRFLAAAYGDIDNEYVDTMQFARKLYPELPNHKLHTLVTCFNLSQNEHRALADCYATNDLYIHMQNDIEEKGIELSNLFYRGINHIRLKDLTVDEYEIDEDNMLFGKVCVFTGTLEKMVRKDAAMMVLKIGGFVDDGVTKKTNYLILGNNDYCSSIKDGKSNKQKKAETLKLKGQDIEIIDEDTFYDLIGY